MEKRKAMTSHESPTQFLTTNSYSLSYELLIATYTMVEGKE